MSVTVLDSATLDAVALATTQPEQLDAIEAAFAGDITVRAMAGAVVAEVCTYGTWVRDSAEPRGMTLGALSACTVNVTDTTITSFVFVEGGTPIFSIPAADASLDSPTTKTGRRTSLADAVLTKHRIIADASLPLGAALTYLLTFALADTATVDVAVSGSITNTGTGACAWSITPPAHVTVTPSSGTLAAGGTQTLVIEADMAGTYSLTLVSAGTTITGATQTVVASEPAEAGTFPTVPSVSTGGLPTLTLTPTATGTHAWTVGHTFKQGDLPAGSSLSGIQCTVKSTWPDGSAKIAVLAGGCPMTAATARTVGLQIGAAPGGAALGTAALAAALTQPVTVDAGAFGSASWSGADWAAPFQTWVSGPLMSSWVYRKPVGSDAHLVAWLEVRLWTNGEVEVLPWVENGYLRVAGPGERVAVYTFTMGGTSRFSETINLRHHQRAPLVSGTALSHWLGTDKGVIAAHDVAYLQDTEIVPAYMAELSAGNARVAALPTTFTPLQQGSFTYSGDYMPSTGFNSPIGLLPLHDVLYLVADETERATVSAAVVRNGYSAGRYGIHYRDEATNRPIIFTDQPTLNVAGSNTGMSDTGGYGDRCPVPTGTAPPTWDRAHHPSVGFMAYLVTGRFYFMEQVQFAATANYLGVHKDMRENALALCTPNPNSRQTRDAAWSFRTLAQALAATADEDALKDGFLTAVENNIDRHHATYVAQANNVFGWVQNGEPGAYDDGERDIGAPWQQDFYTASWGYGLSLGLTAESTRLNKMQEFFAWKAKSIVGRFGTDADYPFEDASQYTFPFGTSPTSDYLNGAGPWFASWAAAYESWFPAGSTKVAGALTLGPKPEEAMWGNLQPALSYAVRHGVEGATAAYARMTGASNWSALAGAFNTNTPVWSVKPLRDPNAEPAWLEGKPLNEWFAISGTTGAGGSAVNAFSGFVVRDDTSELFIAAAGGHNDSSDNRVVGLDLRLDSPTWVLRGETPAATLDGNASEAGDRAINVSHYSDGRPTSRHNYRHNHWLPHLGRVMLVGCRAEYAPTTVGFRTVDGFNPATNRWDAAGTYAPVPIAGTYGEVRDGSYNVWTPFWHRYKVDGTWDSPATTGASAASVRSPMVYDPARNSLVCFQWADGFGSGTAQINCTRLNLNTMVRSVITINSSSARTQFEADQPQYMGAGYCPDNDKFLFYSGSGVTAGRMYWLTANTGSTWDLEIATFGPGSATLPATFNGGLNSRLRYVPLLKGFVLMPSAASGLYFLRTA